MRLTEDEKRIEDGLYGAGAQRAMNYLVKLGDALGAEKMVKVTTAHILSSLPTELLKEMTEGLTETRTVVSLMPTFDPKYWREKYNIISTEKTIGGVAMTSELEYAENSKILKKLKVIPTFSCTPYLIGIVPRRNDVCVWAGTSGQNIANSLFGARAPRESVSTCLASGITGVIPYQGLLKPENRFADLVIDVKELDIPNFTIADYGVLGYYVGKVAGTRNVVFNNLPNNLTLEQAKYLISPLTVDGACTMCHIVGVTPEAPNLEAAIGNNRIQEIITIQSKDLEAVRDTFMTAMKNEVQLVVFGCPHCTIIELRKLASLLDGKRVKKEHQLMVGVSNPTYALAKEASYIDIIEKAGAIITNCCVSGLNPLVHISGMNCVATNSARATRFFRTQTAGKCRTYYANMEDCIGLIVT